MGAQPHNGWDPVTGRGRKEFLAPDPITGEMIGGQIAYIRTAMRFPRFVAAWARRQGKTRSREWLYVNEATVTPGWYRAGLLLPDHTTAFKIFETFLADWGGMVKDAKGDDKSQDRWIELHPMAPLPEPRPWFDNRLRAMWQLTQTTPNAGVKVWFWSGQHPYYQKIQGFPFPFNRISPDECSQLHRGTLKIVLPMLRDVAGFADFSSTPDVEGIGNDWLEDFYELGQSREPNGWASLRFPDGVNPHVPRTDLAAARREYTEAEIRQSLYAEFLTDQGAVFSNLDAVFILPALPKNHESLAWIGAMLLRFPLPSMEFWVHEAERIPGHIYGVSIDWARSPKGDYSVLGVYDFTTARQVALFRWRGENFIEQMETVLAVQRHYGAEQCHSDAQGIGASMSDFFRRRRALGFVGHRFTASSKPDYIRKAQILFREAAVSLINCPEQRGEFKSYMAHEADSLSSEKHITYGAPHGKFDDMVSSMLHVGMTMTIIGRQIPDPPEPPPPTLFDKEGRTTLAQWLGEGNPSPLDRYDDEDAPGLVLPPGYLKA